METKKNHIPFQATHPGILLKDELQARNISQSDFAVEIDMQKTMLNEIIKGKRPVTADLAVILETALEIPADYWMRFQTQYELDTARIKQKNIQRVTNINIWKIIKDYVPVNYFKKIGYLINDLPIDIAKLKEVYVINNVEELLTLSATHKYSLYRKSEKLKINEKNVLAWNVVAKYEAKTQTVNEFNLDSLTALCNELQTVFYQNSSSVDQVREKLKQYGIKFVLVPKLEQTPIDGYTFWSGNNPTIALTLRHTRIDNFAFTIMHEIGHIILHIKNDKEKQFFDLHDKNALVKQLEDEADNFAQEKLIPDEIWNEITAVHAFDDINIIKFATKYKINPAIILGRINYTYKHYNIVELFLQHIQFVQQPKLFMLPQTGELLDTGTGRDNLDAGRSIHNYFRNAFFAIQYIIHIIGRGKPQKHIQVSQAKVRVKYQHFFSLG
jgi:HTH-type transcriptional regulator/antitoxin HigA